jgi:hypothetical protein
MKRWGRGPAGTEEKGNGEWVAEKRQRRREGTRARTKSPDAQTWWLNRGYAVQPLAGADSAPTGTRRKMSHRRGVAHQWWKKVEKFEKGWKGRKAPSSLGQSPRSTEHGWAPENGGEDFAVEVEFRG